MKEVRKISKKKMSDKNKNIEQTKEIIQKIFCLCKEANIVFFFGSPYRGTDGLENYMDELNSSANITEPKNKYFMFSYYEHEENYNENNGEFGLPIVLQQKNFIFLSDKKFDRYFERYSILLEEAIDDGCKIMFFPELYPYDGLNKNFKSCCSRLGNRLIENFKKETKKYGLYVNFASSDEFIDRQFDEQKEDFLKLASWDIFMRLKIYCTSLWHIYTSWGISDKL